MFGLFIVSAWVRVRVCRLVYDGWSVLIGVYGQVYMVDAYVYMCLHGCVCVYGGWCIVMENCDWCMLIGNLIGVC